MGASFRLDGSATLRFTAVDALVAGEGLAALARLGGQLASARDALAAIRAALDALVGLLTLLAALAAAAAAVARGASGGTAILGAAAVPLAYSALIPCRRVLLRLAFRALMRTAMGAAVPAALRRADPRRAGP